MQKALVHISESEADCAEVAQRSYGGEYKIQCSAIFPRLCNNYKILYTPVGAVALLFLGSLAVYEVFSFLLSFFSFFHPSFFVDLNKGTEKPECKSSEEQVPLLSSCMQQKAKAK